MAEYDLQTLDQHIEDLGHPVEQFDADPYHPDSDPYMARERRIRRMLVDQSAKMRPKQVESVKQAAQGRSYKEIAKNLGLTPTTVSKHVRSPEGRELLNLIRTMQAHRSGPTAEHRAGILYRIAVDNEKDKPTVTISAIQEINKMEGSYKRDESDNTKIQIVINNDLMPRTTLDHDGT